MLIARLDTVEHTSCVYVVIYSAASFLDHDSLRLDYFEWVMHRYFACGRYRHLQDTLLPCIQTSEAMCMY